MSEFVNFLNSIEQDDIVKIQDTYRKVYLNRFILNDINQMPIHLACLKGSSEACKFLIQQGCDFENKDKWGMRPIHIACKYGTIEIVKILIENNCDLECMTSYNESCIHFCCQFGHIEIISLLIKNNCSIDKEGPNGLYPIHIACQFGHLETVKLLIENKCQKNIINKYGYMAVHIACKFGEVNILEYLIEQNCDIEGQKEWAGKPIHLTCQNGHLKILKILLEKQCLVDSLTTNGQTALHYAVENNHEDIIKLLLINGAATDITNNSNETPLQLAQQRKFKACEQLLIDWNKHKNIVNILKTKDLKQFSKVFPEDDVEDYNYTFFGTLLDMSVWLNANKITEYLIKKSTKTRFSRNTLIYFMDLSQKLPSRILQEFLIYQAIKFKSEKQWNWTVSINVINTESAAFGKSFIEAAAEYSDETYVKRIMKTLLKTDNTWESALRLSIDNQRFNITDLIINRMQYLNTRTLAKMNRLHVAVDDNRVDIVKYILENDIVDPNDNSAHVGTPLHMAYMYGRLECIQILELYTKNTYERNKFRQTILHTSIDNGPFELIMKTLDINLDINSRDMSGCIPLHCAIINKREDIVEILLNRESNLNAIVIDLDRYWNVQSTEKENCGKKFSLPISKTENAFSLCLKLNATLYKSLEKCLSGEVTRFFVDGYNNSLLHLAAVCVLPNLCMRLISNGANTNKNNLFGNTPLHELLAHQKSNLYHEKKTEFYETVLVLTRNGTDINIKNHSGENSIQCSLKFDDELLTENVIKFSSIIVLCETDFIKIVKNKWITVIKLIINKIQKSFIKEDILITCAKDFTSDIFISFWQECDDNIKSSSTEKLLYILANDGNIKLFQLCCGFPIENPKLLENGETILTHLIKHTTPLYFNYFLNFLPNDILIDMPNKNGQNVFDLVKKHNDMDLINKLGRRNVNQEAENEKNDYMINVNDDQRSACEEITDISRLLDLTSQTS